MPLQNGMPPNQPPTLPPAESKNLSGWAVSAAILGLAAIIGLAYAQYQKKQADTAALNNRTLNASLTQLQEQLQSVTERLNQRIEQEARPKPAPPPVIVERPAIYSRGGLDFRFSWVRIDVEGQGFRHLSSEICRSVESRLPTGIAVLVVHLEHKKPTTSRHPFQPIYTD